MKILQRNDDGNLVMKLTKNQLKRIIREEMQRDDRLSFSIFDSDSIYDMLEQEVMEYQLSRGTEESPLTRTERDMIRNAVMTALNKLLSRDGY